MTNFLHWRKSTWAFVLWSAYIATWTLITGPGPAMVALWWLAGMIALGSLLFATQPVFQQGPGLSGLFVWPGWPDARFVNSRRPSTPRRKRPVTNHAASALASSAQIPEKASIGRRSPPPTFPGSGGMTWRH
jgi:hypothetical protein